MRNVRIQEEIQLLLCRGCVGAGGQASTEIAGVPVVREQSSLEILEETV